MWQIMLCMLIYVSVIVITAPTDTYCFESFEAIVFEGRRDVARGPQYTISTDQDQKHPYIEVRNATYHGLGPREEARAMCAVKTQEVNATANATITRRLHGVVTSRELHNAIQRLEVIIFGQMQQLWQSLDALRIQLSSTSKMNYPDRRSISFRFRPNNY